MRTGRLRNRGYRLLTAPALGRTATEDDTSSLAAPSVAHDNRSVTTWQQPLPLPWRIPPGAEHTSFAHPAERELGRILTFHGVRWVYEPTTFVLERDAAGNPTLCFNPDFYLPDHNRYLELTTMRQALVTRKNRKLRLLRERYPSVDAHIVYRRDFERLAERSRMHSASTSDVAGDTLLTAGQIDSRMREVANEVASRAIPDVLISLGSGASRFATAFGTALAAHGVQPLTAEMSLSRAGATSSARRLRVHRAPRVALDRRRVLVVTDVVSTGLTADFAVRWLSSRGAGPIEVIAMVDRPAARILTVPIRASIFTVDDKMVAGHGMSVGGRYGELANIVEVRRDAGERPT